MIEENNKVRMTMNEFSEKYQVSINTVWGWVKNNTSFKTVKIGGRRYIYKHNAESFMKVNE